jgi:hypothetical protein
MVTDKSTGRPFSNSGQYSSKPAERISSESLKNLATAPEVALFVP